MALTEETKRLLLSAVGNPEARDNLVEDIESQGENKASVSLDNLSNTEISSDLLAETPLSFSIGAINSSINNIFAQGANLGGITLSNYSGDTMVPAAQMGLDSPGSPDFYIASSAGAIILFPFTAVDLNSTPLINAASVLVVNGPNGVTIKSPTLASSYDLTLPVDAGTENQLLATDGNGVTSWITSTGGGASTALDNLTATSISENLLPSARFAFCIGSTTLPLDAIYSDGNMCTQYVISDYDIDGNLIGIGELRPLSSGSPHVQLHSQTGGIVLDSASLGIFGVSPVAKQGATGNTANTPGSGVPVLADTTFAGSVGTTEYTIGDIVSALKNYGLLIQ